MGGGLIDLFVPIGSLPVQIKMVDGIQAYKIDKLAAVRKKGGYPKSVKDGVFVGEVDFYPDLVNAITDRIPEDEVEDWFYKVFTKTSIDVFSYDGTEVKRSYFYDFTNRDENISIYQVTNYDILDPVEKIEYGHSEELTRNNTDSSIIYMNYKGNIGNRLTKDNELVWKNKSLNAWQRHFLTHVLKNYPAAVNDDGTVRYWLDPKDYTKKIDGTESDWNNPDFDGNFCAWISAINVSLGNGYSRPTYELTKMWDLEETRNLTFNAAFDVWDSPLKRAKGIWIPMIYQSRGSKRDFNSEIKFLNTDGDRLDNSILNGYYLTSDVATGGVAPGTKNKHRQPMGISVFELINMILLFFSSDFRVKNLINPKTTHSTINTNGMLNDNGSSPLPGFAFDENDPDGLTKVFHSIAFFSNRAFVLDPTFERQNTVSDTGGAFRKWPGLNMWRRTGLNSNGVLYEPYTNNQIPGGTTTKAYAIYGAILYGLEVLQEITISNKVATSETGVCSLVQRRDLKGNGTSQVTEVPIRFLSPNVGAEVSPFSQYWVTSWGNTVTESERNIILEYLIPDLDYDPFEATGYHPWLNED